MDLTTRKACHRKKPHDHQLLIEGIWMSDRTEQQIAACDLLREQAAKEGD